MKRSVWSTGLLVVVLLSGATSALAQSVAARAVPIGAAYAPSPATLGRPIAVTPPRQTPDPSVVNAGYNPATHGPIAVTPVGLSSPRPWPVDVYDPNGPTDFAADRQVQPVTQAVAATTGPGPQPITRVSGQMMPMPVDGQSYPVMIHQTPSVAPLGGIPAKIATRWMTPTATSMVTTQPGQVEPSVPCPPEVPCEVGPWFDPNRCGYYVRGEYLLWWVNGYDVPVLAATSNQADQGFLGQPSTRVLSDSNINRGALSGMRLTAGYMCDCDEGFEVSAFFLGNSEVSNTFRGTEFPVLSRPFFDGVGQNRELVSFPGAVVGDLTISSPMNLWGIDANFRYNWCCSSSCECADVERSYRVDMLFGPRYLDLTERLTIQENIIGLDTSPDPRLANQFITVTDSFGTRNQFYGGQVGLDAEVRRGRWTFGARGKVAIGVTHQTVDIDGTQRFVSLQNGAVQNFKGGLLALEGRNIGEFTKDRFSVVPELTMTAGYHLTDHIRVYGGYNLLYWSSVVRPGDQIDTQLDTSRIPNFLPPGVVGTNNGRPIVPFKTSDFWAHGLLFGLEVRY